MTTIVELVDVCDERCATNLGWFVVLGERVAEEADPALQRVWAVAAHRHAWHAELWAQRRPAIPHDAVRALPEPTVPEVGDDLVSSYRRFLERERSVLGELRAATDPELDPSTHRVVDLVDADLADLQRHLG